MAGAGKTFRYFRTVQHHSADANKAVIDQEDLFDIQKAGTLPAITDRRLNLILGADLHLIKARAKSGVRLRVNQCFCLKCRAPRTPAFGIAEYIPYELHRKSKSALQRVWNADAQGHLDGCFDYFAGRDRGDSSAG